MVLIGLTMVCSDKTLVDKIFNPPIIIEGGNLRTTMGKNSKELLLNDYSVEIFKERYKRLLKGFEL